MEPTTIETVFWSIVGIISLLTFIIAPFINPHYDPKGDDPYRYCPKEDEQ